MHCQGPGSAPAATRAGTRNPPTAQQLTLVYVAVLARGTVECGGAEVAGPDAAANQLCRLLEPGAATADGQAGEQGAQHEGAHQARDMAGILL